MVKLRDELLDVVENVSPDVHEMLISKSVLVALFDILKKSWIYQSNDLKEDTVFKERTNYLICFELSVVIPVYSLTLSPCIVKYNGSVFVAEPGGPTSIFCTHSACDMRDTLTQIYDHLTFSGKFQVTFSGNLICMTKR